MTAPSNPLDAIISDSVAEALGEVVEGAPADALDPHAVRRVLWAMANQVSDAAYRAGVREGRRDRQHEIAGMLEAVAHPGTEAGQRVLQAVAESLR